MYKQTDPCVEGEEEEQDGRYERLNGVDDIENEEVCEPVY